MCATAGADPTAETVAAQDAEIEALGPPCHPWCKGGKGGGWNNPLSHLFLKSIDWAKELWRRKVLKAYMAQNTKCLLESRNGEEAPIHRVQRYWAKQMPDWLPLMVWQCCGFHHGHPIDRGRVILISFPRVFKDILNVNPHGGKDALPVVSELYPEPKLIVFRAKL